MPRQVKPAVFVFAQAGCGACEEYVPRFNGVVRSARPSCPVGTYDLAKDRHAQEFANRLGVQATPTTVVMDSHGHLHRFVGALADSAIRQLLKRAV